MSLALRRKIVLPPSMDDIGTQIEHEKCLRSFAHFVKTFWHIIEPGTPLIWSWSLQAICDHLQAVDEGVFNKLVICIPPGHAKSTIVSCMWPAWTWLRSPWLRSMFGSYDERLTFRDSVRCKDIINSSLYQDLMKPGWKIRSDVNSMGEFANTEHGTRKCYYMGSGKKTGWRGNYVIVDDPLSAEDRNDPRKKLIVIDSWDKVLSTRPNRAYKYAFVIIMQRLAEDDLAGHIMRKYGDQYVYLILPAEFDPDRRCQTPIFRDPRMVKGELLAPDFFPQSAIDEIKFSLGEVDYAAQYQHLPYPIGGNRFKIEYLQFWNYTNVNMIIELHYGSGRTEILNLNNLQYRFLSADLASTEKKTADYTSIGHWGVTQNNELILLYRDKFKLGEPDVIKKLKSIYSMGQFGRIPPTRVCVEANGLGKPIAQHAANEGLPVEEITVHKDKIVMSASAVTRMAGGQIFLPSYETYPWMQEFIAELVSFPGGPHDDDVSMISIASNSLFEVRTGSPRSAVTIPNTKPRIDANKTKADLSKRNLFGVGNGNGSMNGNGSGDYGRR